MSDKGSTRVVPEPGIHQDIPFEEYVEWDAVNNSSLTRAARSMAHYRYAPPQAETKALRFGKLCHSGALEPLLIPKHYVVMPDLAEGIRRADGTEYASPRATAEYKRRAAEFKEANADKEVVDQDTYDTMMGVVDALLAHERARAIAAALGWFREHGERVAREVTLQMGKPLAEARGEVATLLARAEECVARAPEFLAPEVQPPLEGFVRRIEHAPLGVVLDIAAWNYPLIIAVNVVAPALLAGNAVLIKHSALTPLCAQAFEEAFGALEPGLVRALVLDHPRTAELIADPRIDHVAFTGSVEGGRAVQRAARERFLDVGLELGGKDAAYVAEDADLEFAAPNVVEGALYNAGQSCCAVERVYVHASRYEEFLERARAALDAWVVGDPLAEGTTLGPLAQRRALGFLQGQVEGALARGARLLAGGGPLDERCFAPTLIADVPQDCSLMQDESFGPLVPVASVASDDEGVARINDCAFGLTASLWTSDLERAERLLPAVQAGTIYMNRCDYIDPAQPWTGWKDSGRGSTRSRHGFYALTRRKAVHLRQV